MFVVVLKYVKPLEVVDSLLADHVKFLDAQYAQGKFLCSGRRNPRVGGVILANVGSAEEMQQIIAQDPFYQQQAAEYDVIEFEPTKMDERFAALLK